MLICTMLMIEVIIMMITRIIMMTMRSKRKKTGGGGGWDHFSLQISPCQREKQLDQRTADIRSFLVKVTRISVNRCTRLR